MKKYTCFNEFCGHEMYGVDLADALMHVGKLPRPGKPGNSGGHNGLIPQPPVVVATVLGYEDVSNSRRGDRDFVRAIIEDADGIRHSVDVMEGAALQEVA